MFIKTTIIDFYGHFGDINAALDVFNGIDDDKKTIANINSMITALIENKDDIKALKIYDTYKYRKNTNEISDLAMACKHAKICTRKHSLQIDQYI